MSTNCEQQTPEAEPQAADTKTSQTSHKGGKHLGANQQRANHEEHHPLRNLRTILTVAAIVVALVVGLAIGNGGLVTQGATHVDSTTIKNSFADVAELATQEYDFSNVGKFSQDDMKILDLSIPFTGRSFLITYSGEVKAGIEDISQASVAVDNAAKTVNITLPQVTVLDSHIDTNSVQTYDQTLNPINQISVDDVTSFLSNEENSRRDEAINGGILDKARSRAESLITTNVRALLSNSAEKDYQINITWQDSNQDSSDSSQNGANTSSASTSEDSAATETSSAESTSSEG